MKRLYLLFTILLTFLTVTPANAAQSSLIFITTPSHSQISGLFLDDQLATDLGPTGAIGKLLYSSTARATRWEVDPALIEEAVVMSNGYKVLKGVGGTSGTTAGTGQDVAKAFLARVSTLAHFGLVDAMVYGNPSEYWVMRLTPHEHTYLFTASQTRLATLLKSAVGAPANYISTKYFNLSGQSVVDLRNDYATIQSNAIYMAPADLDSTRLSLVRLLNPQMSRDRRLQLLDDLNSSITNLSNNIRLAPGRFTITSSSQTLPITVINDFPETAKVDLIINSLNERVAVDDIHGVVVNGKSKVQVMVPIKVLTSGTSGLSIVIQNTKGEMLGTPQLYSLNLKVISPIATWITTGAAIVLFFAALLQSLRRIRKRRVV